MQKSQVPMSHARQTVKLRTELSPSKNQVSQKYKRPNKQSPQKAKFPK